MSSDVAKILTWRENVPQFAYDNFGLELDQWQIDGLNACSAKTFNPRRRIGFKAATGVGKTTELAIIGWHRLSCFGEKGEHPKGAAISGEGRDNLRDNLWTELLKLQDRSEFLKSQFVWNKEQITSKFHKGWFLSARSYAKNADIEAIGRSLSGLHSKYPFVLLDEIGDAPPQLGQKATQIFTGGVEDALIAAAGNPTSTSGLLYFISEKERHLWEMINITADPDDPKRSSRVDPEHAREQIELHGKDNPWVMSTILGLFPPQGFNSLLGIEDVEAAMRRSYRKENYDFAQKRLGVDVALEGDDRTVLFPRQGLVAFQPVIMRTQEPADISARMAKAKQQWGQELELIDNTGGYGSGVISHYRMGGHSPMGIHSASKAGDKGFYNKRAEMWWRMADWIKNGGALPNISELVAELTTPTYTYKSGRLIIEAKDQVKKRLGRSPDLADALAHTFALPDMPAKDSLAHQMFKHNNKTSTDWNPFL